jgi:hypothetical protein
LCFGSFLFVLLEDVRFSFFLQLNQLSKKQQEEQEGGEVENKNKRARKNQVKTFSR